MDKIRTKKEIMDEDENIETLNLEVMIDIRNVLEEVRWELDRIGTAINKK